MTLRSNIMIVGIGVCWAACLMLFSQQIVFKFDERDNNGFLWLSQFSAILYFGLCMSMLQDDLLEPSPADFHALPTVVNVIVYLLLLLPFFFVKQLATGQFAGNYFALVAFFSHAIVGFMRFWRGCYYIMACLLVGVVSVSFNLNVNGEKDNKFFILGISAVIVSLSNCYFGVRRAEVARAQQAQKTEPNRRSLIPT